MLTDVFASTVPVMAPLRFNHVTFLAVLFISGIITTCWLNGIVAQEVLQQVPLDQTQQVPPDQMPQLSLNQVQQLANQAQQPADLAGTATADANAFIGAPYPLPDLPPTPNDNATPGQAALALDEKKPTTALPSNPTGESLPQAQAQEAETPPSSPALSLELIGFLKEAVQREQQSLSRLLSDITELRKELKQARAASEKRKTETAKQGNPDSLVLSLEFPRRQQTNSQAQEQGPEEAPNAEKPITPKGSQPTATATTTLKPLLMKLKPIPVIYASQDARSALANAAKNAEELEAEQAAYVEQQEGDIEKDPTVPYVSKISEIQTHIDELAAKVKYFQEDAAQTNNQMEAAVHQQQTGLFPMA